MREPQEMYMQSLVSMSIWPTWSHTEDELVPGLLDRSSGHRGPQPSILNCMQRSEYLVSLLFLEGPYMYIYIHMHAYR